MVIIMQEKEVVLKLYHNVYMGIIGIECITDKIKERPLLKIILAQKSEYENLKNELLNLCEEYHVLNKDISPLAKVSSEMMSKMKLMGDNTSSHIAKMMMEGTNKGLIELEKINNNYTGTDEKLKKLISEIIKVEQQNNEDLKGFL